MATNATITPALFGLITIGSDRFIDSRGRILIDGEEQVVLERGERDDQLLATIDLRDETGKMIGKFRRNAWAFHDAQTFEVTTSPRHIRLVEVESGREVFAAAVTSPNSIEISKLDIYGPEGIHVKVGRMLDPSDPLKPPVQGITVNGQGAVMVGNTHTGTDGIQITKSGISL